MSQLRWQTVDDRSDVLFEHGRRVVGNGEYRSLTFHEVDAKTIINHVPAAAGLPFEYTINPYRGCSHACVYCFARPTHEYLGFDVGRDFDTQIVVKLNAVELTRAETAPGRWGGASIAMGTNTDPYQKAEGKYRLTRGIAEVLVERGNPFSILTKSTLALRDLDVFRKAPHRVTVDFSIPTLDESVWKRTEPGTPHPRRRIEAVAALNDAGIPSGVLVAPLLPGMSDAADQVAEVLAAAADAGARFASPMTLHLKPGLRAHWFDWLSSTHPELVGHYRRLYRGRSFVEPRSSRRGSRWSERRERTPPAGSGQLSLDFSAGSRPPPEFVPTPWSRIASRSMADPPVTPATLALDAAHVGYRISHHGKVSSAEEAAAARGIPIDALAKSLVVRLDGDRYVIVLIPADRSLSYPKLRAVLGVRRLTMPSPDEARQATGYERGTITPLGSGGWPTYVDERLAAHAEVSLGSGVHGWAIAMSPRDLIEVTDAQLVDISGP